MLTGFVYCFVSINAMALPVAAQSAIYGNRLGKERRSENIVCYPDGTCHNRKVRKDVALNVK